MHIVLSPARVREDRFARAPGDPVKLDWLGLLDHLGIRGHREEVAKLNLINVKYGTHLGIVRGARTGRLTVFVVTNGDHSGNIGWILKNDPTFPGRIVRAFRVEDIGWDASVAEEKGPTDSETLAILQHRY